MMKRLLLIIIGLALLCDAYSQSVAISGTVYDADTQSPLPGVSIVVKGSIGGTMSDAQGKYRIEIPQDGILIFSFIGATTQEIAYTGQSTVDVYMQFNALELEGVTVTALGIKREKRVLGYSVSDIKSENIAGNGEVNPIASIAGKVAGVSITGTTAGPTGSTRVVIRGIRELQSNSQPLYVIDGVPAVSGNLGSASQWGGFDLGDGLSDINPNDIETISVLKGSAASALYGSRALNGVILITTKTGNSGKGLGIEYNSSLTIDEISTKLDARQKKYGQGRNGVLSSAPLAARDITTNWGPAFDEVETIKQMDNTDRPYEYMENNIQDFFKSGKTFMNTISVTGGNENTNMRLSYSNVTNSDIIPTSGYDKDIFSLRTKSKITQRLTADTKVSYAVDRVRNRPALTDDVNNIGNGLLGLAANFDQAWLQRYQNEDGSYIDYTGNIYRANPYWTINRTHNKSNKERIGGFINLNYEVSSAFSVNLQGGTDFFTFKHENFYDKFTPAFNDGGLTQLDMNVKETNFQGMINFKKDINDAFKIGIMSGGNLMRYRSYGTNTSASQIIQPGTANFVNFKQILVSPFDDRKEIQSVFVTANLAFKEFVFLNVQGRNDWASTLPPHNNSFFYPSADLSVVLTDAFNVNSSVLSFIKIRGSAGQVGNDFQPYQTGFAYSLTGRSLSGQPMGEILGTTIPNSDLKPQIKTSFELGTDIRLLDDRLGLDFTYYNEVTDDVLLNIPVPRTTGFQTAALNAGKLKNHGVEVLLSATPIHVADGFRWDLSVNFAKNMNKVIKLNELLETFTVAEARWAGATIIAEEGKPFGTIMGNDFLRDANGNKSFSSANGLPLFTNKPIAIGNSLPDWTGGLINTVSFKGFQLKTAIDIRMGGDIFSMTNMTMHMNGSHANTEVGRESWNEYQQERRAAELAAAAAGQSANVDTPGDPYYVPRNDRGYIGEGVNEQGEKNNIAVNPADYWQTVGGNIPSAFIYDASYVKLRDVGLSYTLPSSVTRNTPFRSVSLGVIGRNLWIIYKNTPNIDPESNYNVSNGQGFEYGSLPGRRRYGFNLVVKF
jgi:TonB-linked SusC/RagA family outer membrane protein